MVRAFVLGLVLVLVWAGSAAAATCSRPLPPACAGNDAAFADRTAVTQCHRDVQAYVGAMVNFLQCLTDEHTAAGKEMNHVVHLFNCRLAGQTPCPAEAGNPPSAAAPAAPAAPAARATPAAPAKR